MSIKKNTLWSLAGSGLPLLAAAALIPCTLNALGNELFGVLTLIWVLIGYLSLFDMGVGRSLTYEISKLNAINAQSQIISTLKAGVLLTVVTGLLGATCIWFLSPSLVVWLKISAAFQPQAIVAFKLCAIAVIPTTITSGFRGAMEGMQQFAQSNILKLIVGFSMFVMPALAIKLHGVSLVHVTIYLCVTRLLVFAIAVWQLRELLFAKLSSQLSQQHFKQLFHYGFWITVTGIISPLMVYGDRFYVSNIMGAAELPYYAIPQEALLRLLIIPASLAAALMPLLSAANTSNLQVLYQTYYQKTLKIMLVLCGFAAVFAYPIMHWWLTPTFANKAIVIALILVVGIFINGMSQIPYTLIQARGKPKLTALFHIMEFIIYIPLIWLLVSNYGLLGAAVAWVIRVTVDFILLRYLANQLSKISYSSKVLY